MVGKMPNRYVEAYYFLVLGQSFETLLTKSKVSFMVYLLSIHNGFSMLSSHFAVLYVGVLMLDIIGLIGLFSLCIFGRPYMIPALVPTGLSCS